MAGTQGSVFNLHRLVKNTEGSGLKVDRCMFEVEGGTSEVPPSTSEVPPCRFFE